MRFEIEKEALKKEIAVLNEEEKSGEKNKEEKDWFFHDPVVRPG